MMSKARKGLSLAETLVGVTLALLVLGILFQVLGPTTELTARETERIELQQRGTVALRRLSTDLERSAPAGVAAGVPTPGSVLTIHQLRGLTAQGTQDWEDLLRVYIWNSSSQELSRQEWPPGPTLSQLIRSDVPFRPGAGDLVSLGQHRFLKSRTICRGLTQFEVELGQPMLVKLELEGPKQQSLEMTRRIYLRNSAL